MSVQESNSKLHSLLNSLCQIKQELTLQTHLMTMDLRQQWRALEQKIANFEHAAEHSLEELAKRVGQAEAHFFVGNEQELQQLVDALREVKSEHDANKH